MYIPVKEELRDWISLNSLGFPNYECHRSGLIRRISKDKLLGYPNAKSGYPIIELKDPNGQKKTIKSNIIICTIFHGNPPNDNSEAIHIDDNRLNLNADNMRWGTPTDKLLSERAKFRNEDHINNLTLTEEEWKDGTPYGYPGYRASTFGRLYSEKTGKILEGWSFGEDGYIKTKIMLNGQATDIQIHVVICTIFHGFKPHPDHTVDHIDRIKINNRPSNLRWASKSKQAFNRGKIKRNYLIAQIKGNRIIDFHNKQATLEIFDVDDLLIPDDGLIYNGYLWIYENFTNFDMMNEIWKPINIGGIIYQISNMGRVETKKRKTFGSTTIQGYKQVGLSGQSFYVHRLVMIAFNGIIDGALVVNHIDADKSNNKLSNLEITTYSGNSIYSILLGSKSTKPVRQLSLNGDVVAEFSSIQSAANFTNILPKNIGNCANGKQLTAGSFIWEHI